MAISSDTYDNEQLLSYIKNLEQRVSRIEFQLDIQNPTEDHNVKSSGSFLGNRSKDSDDLENEIGQFWLAKIGIIVLVLGLIFVLTFPFKSIPQIFPSVFGFAIVLVLLTVSKFLKNSYELLSRYLFGSSLMLAFFSVLRLHYFNTAATIESTGLLSIFLYLVAASILFVSIRRGSIYLTSLGIILTSFTALINGTPILAYLTFSILSTLIVYLKIRKEWSGLFNSGMLIILLAHFWFSIGNYFFADPQQTFSFSILNQLFITIYVMIFSSANIFMKNELNEDFRTITSIVLSSILPYLLLFGLSISKYRDSLITVNLLAAIIFLVLAVIFWNKYESKYSTFLYAMTGYASLSVAIVGYFPKPDYFVWLSWQSFLVVSTSIWFRSKFIIVANFIIYLLIYFTYLILAGSLGVISLSFGFVALLSARVLNWQKDRLQLKTEMMRIAYLVAAFFIFPYALYHIVPHNYVSLSWMVVALFYLVLGIVLKNIKYRWMSLATLFLTVLYVLTIGSTNFDPSFRILSFVVLGIGLIITSIFYTKRRKNQTDNSQELSDNTK